MKETDNRESQTRDRESLDERYVEEYRIIPSHVHQCVETLSY